MCVPNCCMHCERFLNLVLIFVIGHIRLSNVDYLVRPTNDSTWWSAALLSQTSAVVSISVIAHLPSIYLYRNTDVYVRPSDLLCCWFDGLELVATVYEIGMFSRLLSLGSQHRCILILLTYTAHKSLCDLTLCEFVHTVCLIFWLKLCIPLKRLDL